MSRRGALRTGRPPKTQGLPEHPCRRGLPSLGEPVIHLQLRVSLHAERDCQSLDIHSHLRRVSLPAARRCRVQT